MADPNEFDEWYQSNFSSSVEEVQQQASDQAEAEAAVKHEAIKAAAEVLRTELASHEKEIQEKDKAVQDAMHEKERERQEKEALIRRLKETEELLLKKLTEKEVQLMKEQEHREAIEARLVEQRQLEEEDAEDAKKLGEVRNMWKGYPVLTRKVVPLEVAVASKTVQKIYVSAGRVICFRFRFSASTQTSAYSRTMGYLFTPTDLGFKLSKRHGEFAAEVPFTGMTSDSRYQNPDPKNMQAAMHWNVWGPALQGCELVFEFSNGSTMQAVTVELEFQLVGEKRRRQVSSDDQGDDSQAGAGQEEDEEQEEFLLEQEEQAIAGEQGMVMSGGRIDSMTGDTS